MTTLNSDENDIERLLGGPTPASNAAEELRLSLDEKHLLKLTLLPLGFVAIFQLVFSCILSQAIREDLPPMWSILFILLGLQICHAVVTIQAMYEFMKVEQTPSEYLNFFARNWGFLLWRCASDFVLIVFLSAAYAEPRHVQFNTSAGLRVTDKRTILGVCIVTVCLDLASAARSLLVITAATVDQHCTCYGLRVCGFSALWTQRCTIRARSSTSCMSS